MPLREKLRRTFGSRKNGSGDSTPSGSSPPRRKDIEYYKPHEIPKSKYRGKVDPEHKEMLEAYSMVDAFNSMRRRASAALSGTLSPGGTQSQSRRASYMSRGRSSRSMASADSDVDGSSIRKKSVASVKPTEDPVTENEEDDTDVANAGLSRRATRSDESSSSNGQSETPALNLRRTITEGKRSSAKQAPFSAQDLERAMTQATMRPRRGTVVSPVHVQPEGVMV